MKKKKINAKELAKIIRGKRIIDTGSGLEGYGASVTTFLYGCTFIGISYEQGSFGRNQRHLLPSEAVFPDGDVDIDLSEIEIVFDDYLVLGKKCRDKISGFTGVAEQLVVRAGTEVLVVLQPAAIENNTKLPDREMFDYGRLDIIGQQVSSDDVAKPERTGGGVWDVRTCPGMEMCI